MRRTRVTYPSQARLMDRTFLGGFLSIIQRRQNLRRATQSEPEQNHIVLRVEERNPQIFPTFSFGD